jgi:hypothetical protein
MYLGLRCDVESRSRPNLDGDLVNCGVPEVFAIGVFRVTAVKSMDYLCLTAMSKFLLTPDKTKIMLKLLSVESFISPALLLGSFKRQTVYEVGLLSLSYH